MYIASSLRNFLLCVRCLLNTSKTCTATYVSFHKLKFSVNIHLDVTYVIYWKTAVRPMFACPPSKLKKKVVLNRDTLYKV